jgi:hypothetical protein
MSGILTHTPAYILRTRIINDGKGTVTDENRAWPVYVDGDPNLPDNMITVRDTTNVEKGYRQYNKELQQHYGVQVRIRAKSVPVGFPKYNALVVAIERYINDTLIVDGVTYTFTSYVTSDMFVGREMAVSRRPLWTINAMLVIRQESPVPVPTP